MDLLTIAIIVAIAMGIIFIIINFAQGLIRGLVSILIVVVAFCIFWWICQQLFGWDVWKSLLEWVNKRWG